MSNYYTLLTIGQTGAGKSELGNSYLRDPKAFEANASPDAVTFVTSSQERIIDGVVRCCIDTQGMDDTQGIDSKHIQQMVQFMKSWPKGVNAIAIVINGQAPRFDAGTQKLIKIINTFFNNPQFWDHVCLVFTKNFKANPVDRNIVEQEYKKRVQDLVVECTGDPSRRPQLPVFLVDSRQFNNPNDQSTQNDLAALHGFVVGKNPLPTQNVQTPNVNYLRVEPETRTKKLVNARTETFGNGGKRMIMTYEDQKREKMIGFDGKTITYSEWESTKEWDEYEYEKTEIEKDNKVLVNSFKTEFYKTVGGKGGGNSAASAAGAAAGGAAFGPVGALGGAILGHLFGGSKNTHQEHDYYLITNTYEDRERKVTKNFDGSITYGEWVITKTYSDQQRE
jgi:hypothetical protein